MNLSTRVVIDEVSVRVAKTGIKERHQELPSSSHPAEQPRLFDRRARTDLIKSFD